MPKRIERIPGSREEEAWLSDKQLAKCAPADEAEPFRSPIPTQMVSNGEYMPYPQTEKQKRVEARIKELADSASKKLGVSRRQFLLGTGGMAAAFLAMNEIFGRFFNVSPIEMFEPAAYAASAVPSDVFVFDDQLHLVRGKLFTGTFDALTNLRKIAQGLPNPFNPTNLPDEHGNVNAPWNPALVGLPFPPDMFDVIHFIKAVFLDSQVSVGLLSNVTGFLPGLIPGSPPRNIDEAHVFEILRADQTVGVRNFVNQIAGSTRLLAHGLLYVGVGNLDFIRFQIDELKPDSWKGYNISTAAKVDLNPTSLMQQWRLDDVDVAYPTYELITKFQEPLKRTRPGFGNICVHKGLAPGVSEIPEHGLPTDVPKAATDWPNLNFIIYHSSIRPAFFDLESLEEIRSGVLREGVPDIKWTTQFAVLAAPFQNVFAEIGTTFASSVITFPTVTAHILGQLMKFMGKDRIVFGSDSIWYGSPQWQIEAMWRFEIPEALQAQFGYPALTQAAKRHILGLNSARLYRLPSASEQTPQGVFQPVPANFQSLIPTDLKILLEFPGFVMNDNLSKIRTAYQELGVAPSNTRYGWIRAKV